MANAHVSVPLYHFWASEILNLRETHASEVVGSMKVYQPSSLSEA